MMPVLTPEAWLARRHVDALEQRPTAAVAAILAEVQAGGDDALVRLTERYDGVRLDPDALEVPREAVVAAPSRLDPQLLAALRGMAARIGAFHRPQGLRAYSRSDRPGTACLQVVVPLRRVGIYVPGGRAAYPSTVLMAAVPARMAGVEEVVLCTPPSRDGTVPDVVLAAAAVAGVDRVFRVGGAQAVAAMAYGTRRIPRVDKVVGPGNRFVAEAKRQVFGTVGIDTPAGPSEVLVAADGSADPHVLALEALAQAEHDPDALALVAVTGRAAAERAARALDEELARWAERVPASAATARRALEGRGGVVAVADEPALLDFVEAVAPEHLYVWTADGAGFARRVRGPASVFIGPWTTVAAGDYGAGPNHILPTAATARFASPLGVDDFQRRVQVMGALPNGVRAWAADGVRVARAEGLPLHAAALEDVLSRAAAASAPAPSLRRRASLRVRRGGGRW